MMFPESYWTSFIGYDVCLCNRGNLWRPEGLVYLWISIRKASLPSVCQRGRHVDPAVTCVRLICVVIGGK